MMKITLFALCALAIVCALPQQEGAPQPQQEGAPQPQPLQRGTAPAGSQAPVRIVKQDSEVDVNGYNFEFETSDGTSRQEQGEYKNDTDQQGLSVKGSYKYVAPDGQHIAVSFLADKNGFQPKEHRGEEEQKQSP